MRAHQAGFTLIELMAAIAIFAVMATMAYGGLSAVLETREGVTAALERSKTLQMATWRIRRDLEQIVKRPVRDSFGDPQPSILGTPEAGLAVTRNGWRNPLDLPRSSLQRTRYRLDEDNDLVREHWRVLDRAQDSVPVETTLIEDVESLEWRYLNAQREWQDRWPANASALDTPAELAEGAGGAQEAPLAIELRLTTPAWGELRLLFMVPGARA